LDPVHLTPQVFPQTWDKPLFYAFETYFPASWRDLLESPNDFVFAGRSPPVFFNRVASLAFSYEPLHKATAAPDPQRISVCAYPKPWSHCGPGSRPLRWTATKSTRSDINVFPPLTLLAAQFGVPDPCVAGGFKTKARLVPVPRSSRPV